MSSVTFGGLSSGMDTATIVEALMETENAPLERLELQQTINDEKLEAYSSFNDKLTALQSAAEDLAEADDLQSSKTSLSAEGVVSAESTGASVQGTYNIIVKQLSQVQKDVSSGFDSMAESVLGTGSITIGNGDDTATIDITSDNNNLKDFVTAVNKESETTGVTASLINDGSDSGNYRVVFSGGDAGNEFTISSTLTDTTGDFTTSNTQAAQKALVEIDGIAIESDSNTLSDVIPGLSLTLDSVSDKDSEGNFETVRLSVEPDSDAMKEKVNTFINSYNGIIEYLNEGTDDTDSLNSYLRNDSTVNGIKRKMQSILTSTFGGGGSMSMFSQAGISTQSDGTLEVDGSDLTEAIENNLTDFVNMFSGTDDEDGVMDKFITLMDASTDSIDGFYASKKESHDSTEKTLESQILRMETRLAKREDSLNSQFSAMEEMISSLNSQSSYFTSMLSSS